MDVEFEMWMNENFQRDTSAADKTESVTKGMDEFFERLEVQAAIGRTGAALSKADRAEIAGIDESELEKVQQHRPFVKGVAFASMIDPELLVKGGQPMRKAAGFLDHVGKRATSLTNALENAMILVEDDATEEQRSLLRRAINALDISAYLEVLSSVLVKPI